MARLKTAILISGRGSNLQALIEECTAADSAADIALVLSNVAASGGLSPSESFASTCCCMNVICACCDIYLVSGGPPY